MDCQGMFTLSALDGTLYTLIIIDVLGISKGRASIVNLRRILLCNISRRFSYVECQLEECVDFI
jgi:hypothetical protein